jgi:hypothetical protein
LKGDLKGETGSEIIAAQDQALKTKYIAPKILQTETDTKCRLSPQFSATVNTLYLRVHYWQKNIT